ncbi:MAG: MATE family efflux transporter [Lachnospiraceae bacterium]|nr:MATE family efflux transporter [Lachnospiraceae bacterium]
MKANKFIGDKKFYGRVLTVAVPIMIQNGISNFVSLLDNIMIGQIGTEKMSGVAIVNQLMFVLYLGLFGALSGPGIYSAQFFGSGNHEGVRHSFRYKLYIALSLVSIGILVFLLFGENLMTLYLSEEVETAQSADMVLRYGHDYMLVMLIGLIPFAVEETYASTLRECGETRVPMVAGLVAVAVNLCGNYILIFGKFGFPELGVTGAAIATVVSRFVQAGVVVVWTHRHTIKMKFAVGLYKSLKIPREQVLKISVKGLPLMLNELLWSAGMAILNQCYSKRGLDAVAGLNIASTFNNLFNVVFIAMGSAVAIMVGQLLGAGELEEARDTDTKLITFSVASSFFMGIILFLLAGVFPELYNSEDSVKELACGFIRISAVCMPLYAFMHASYFTLRTGGKTFVTFLFDSVFLWGVSVPVAFIISRLTGMPVLMMFFCVQMIDLIKCTIGFILVKKGIWLQNLVKTNKNI